MLLKNYAHPSALPLSYFLDREQNNLSHGKQKGFTLIELILTVTIVSLLMVIAAPSMEKAIWRNKLIATQNQLSSLLQTAKIYAYTDHISVTVCGISRTNKQCESDQWRHNITAFVDKNMDAKLDEDEPIVTQVQQDNSHLNIVGSRRYARFLPDGGLSTPVSIELCIEPDTSSQLVRAIYLSLQGRVRLSSDSDLDGIHDNGRGRNIDC